MQFYHVEVITLMVDLYVFKGNKSSLLLFDSSGESYFPLNGTIRVYFRFTLKRQTVQVDLGLTPSNPNSQFKYKKDIECCICLQIYKEKPTFL